MIIKLWSLFLAAMLLPGPVPTTDVRRLAAKDLQYSVLLHMAGTKEGRKIRAGCSGTYVGPTQILTAAHCFEGYDVKKIFARGPYDAIGYRVNLQKLDAGKDLAVLDAPLSHAYAHLGDNPSVGQEIMNIGSPLGFEFAVSEGIVSITGFEATGYTGRYLITTAMINSGSSGGGAFNKKGQLIGVNTMTAGGLFGWAGISMAVDVNTIRGFLK